MLELDKVALRRGNLSRKALPPLTKSTWWRDLCADGDVEPNPGPLHWSSEAWFSERKWV